jgi:D-methionine transport system ATP-binding protein
MIELRNLSKTYHTADGPVQALKNVSLTIRDGDIYGIIGVSGAGKSTLVRCINLLERPDEGQILVDGRDMTTLSQPELRRMRRSIAMIFQSYNLLMQRSVLDNVCFPLELEGKSRREAAQRARELLKLVDLQEKANAYPAQLSGGQKQRVAIARALATDPHVLLSDEATSALDPTTTGQILELIRSIHEATGITVIMITHQMNVVEAICGQVAILDNGELKENGNVAQVFSHPRSAAARRLLFPNEKTADTLVLNPGEHRIRLVFNGAQATNSPLIANLAMDEGIPANILSASTRSVGDKVYGYMLLGINGDTATVRRATDYLTRTPAVYAQEVQNDEL